MEFLNCSYGEEFYQSPLKHVTCSSVHTRLSGGNADSALKGIAVWWCCGGRWGLSAPGAAVPPFLWASSGQAAVTTSDLCPCLPGDNWSLGAEKGKS